MDGKAADSARMDGGTDRDRYGFSRTPRPPELDPFRHSLGGWKPHEHASCQPQCEHASTPAKLRSWAVLPSWAGRRWTEMGILKGTCGTQESPEFGCSSRWGLLNIIYTHGFGSELKAKGPMPEFTTACLTACFNLFHKKPVLQLRIEACLSPTVCFHSPFSRFSPVKH